MAGSREKEAGRPGDALPPARPSVQEEPPRVGVEAIEVRRAAAPGRWRVTWRVRNESRRTLHLLAARLPHDHFYAPERALSPTRAVGPREATRLARVVAFADPPGAVVENAFLILRVRWARRPWRVFARLRVAVDRDGAPHVRTELVTAQAVRLAP